MNSGSSTPSAAKDERVSWRVPNETRAQETPEDNQSSSRKDSKTCSKGTSTYGDRSKSDSGPNSPADGRKGPKLTKVPSEASLEESKNNFGHKLWRILFGNVVRSIDELYLHCVDQGEIAKCYEVADLLKKGRIDFNKLGVTIDEQSRFQLGQAMSWETRKPTLPSPMNPASGGGSGGGGQSSLDIDTSATSGTSTPVSSNSPVVVANIAAATKRAAVTPTVSPKPDGYDVPISIVTSTPPTKRLNPAAKPFNPNPAAPVAAATATATGSVTATTTTPAVAATVAPVVALVPSGVTSPSAPPSKVPLKVEVPPRSNAVITAGAPGLTKIVPVTVATSITAPVLSASGKGPAAPVKDDIWADELLQAEVLQATEHVWAAAEAWVEAEAEAEEQEWQLLALGINSFLKDADTLSDYEDEPPRVPDMGAPGLRAPATAVSTHSSPKRFPGMGFGEPVAKESSTGLITATSHWEGNFVALSPEQRAIWEHTPPSRIPSAPPSAVRSGTGGNAGTPRQKGGGKAGALHISTPSSPGGKRFAMETPANQVKQIRGRNTAALSPGNYSASLVESGDAGDSGERADYSHRSPSVSPSDSFFASSVAGGASGGRSLHDKLSSPDRKRAMSPTEALRRYEERQINAEMNRDKTVAERIQKANVASQRLKVLEQKEAQRRIDVLKAIQSKMKDAEERKSQYLKQIQVRAFNESSKVNEVIYVNALNSEAIAQRLEEVETRIFAASERRQERLHGMTLDQRRRNSRKAQHLSEWRLQFEKEKMDRWEKLQQRLATVNARRTARLAELQRRADEESRRVLGAVAGVAAVPAVEEVAGAADGVVVEAAVSDAVVSEPLKPATKALASTTVAKPSVAPSKNSSALRKLAVSGNLSGKRNGRTVPQPHSPPPIDSPKPRANSSPAAGGKAETESSAAEEVSAKPSKSKEKRDKRKLKAQLIELAEKAEIAVIQEAIALNGGASEASTVAESAPSAALAKSVVFMAELSHAEVYAQSQQLVRHCPDGCVQEGFVAWSKLAAKRVNVIAKADHEKDRAASVDAGVVVSADVPEGFPVAEQHLIAAMRADGAGNLLACVVNDLLAAAQKPDDSSTLSMHVMQRLYVLLQHASLGSGGEHASDSDGTSAALAPKLSEVLLLRMLFGPEVGVLRSTAQLQTMLDALVFYQYQHVRRHTGSTPSPSALQSKPAVSAVTQELEVQAEVWKLVMDLLLQCSASPAGAALIVQSGLAVVLIDLFQAMLLIMEVYRKNEVHPRSLLGTELDLPPSDDAHGAFDACFPTAVSSVASAAMTVLSRALSVVPQSTGGCSQASLDSLVWYLFTSGQVQFLAENLRNRSQHWQYTQSYHYKAARAAQQGDADADGARSTMSIDSVASSTEFYLAVADYLGSIGNFIRLSGGLALCDWHRTTFPHVSGPSPATDSGVVDSIVQLSPAVHRHSKGRQLVSVVRRADCLQVLVETLAIVASRDYFAPSSADVTAKASACYIDNLLLLGRLTDAVCSLASADISLVHTATHSPEHQLLWVRTMGSLVTTLQHALDGPHQTLLSGGYKGGHNSVCTTKITLGRTAIEESLRTLFVTVAFSCLRNPAVQKLCGTVLPSAGEAHTAGSGAGSVPPASLLTKLCTLTPKYYKDKKFKHSLLPCLVAMCAECDSNIFQLARLDKLATVVKYLEFSVRTYDIYTQQQQRRASAAESAAPALSTDEALHVRRLSNIIPVELWQVTLVTLSRN